MKAIHITALSVGLAGIFIAGCDNAKPTAIEEGAYSDASAEIPITNVSRSGNKVTFTIPQDARQKDEEADKVDITVLFKENADKDGKCPLVKSTSIDKSTEDYDPMSGKATIIATFASEEMAKTAEESDCLLIRDTE